MKIYIGGHAEGIDLPEGIVATAFFNYIEIRDKENAWHSPSLYITGIPLPYDPMPLNWWKEQVKAAIKRLGKKAC